MSPEKTNSILTTKLLHVWRYCSSQESGCLVFTKPNMALPKNNQKLIGSLLSPPQNNSSALTYSVFGLITHSWKQSNSDGDQSQQKDVRDLGCTWFLTEMKSSGYSPFIPLKWQLNTPPGLLCSYSTHQQGMLAHLFSCDHQGALCCRPPAQFKGCFRASLSHYYKWNFLSQGPPTGV